MSRQTLGILIAVLSAVAFAFYGPGARGAYAEDVNAIFMILFTTISRAIALYLFCLFRKQKVYADTKSIKDGMTGGFIQALSIAGIFGGLIYLPSAIVSIVIFTHTLMLLLFMAFKREIKLDIVSGGTTIIAFIGLTFVLDVWQQQFTLSTIGLALTFMGALATMTRIYIYANQMKTKAPAIVGAEAFIFTSLYVCLLAFFEMPMMPHTTMGWVWVSIACLSLVTGTLGMFYGVSMLGAFQFSLLLKLEPIFVAVISAVLLHEILEWQQYFGILLVLGSLACYQLMEYRRKALP